LHQLKKFLLVVCPIPAPPITKGKPGEDGNTTRELLKINNAFGIGFPITKKVKVL
jgi:hypothetical protein